MTAQNAHLTPPSNPHGSEPLMQTPRPLSTQEYNRLVRKRHKTGTLTPEEEALMQAQRDWRAQQFLAALKAGVREGIETP